MVAMAFLLLASIICLCVVAQAEEDMSMAADNLHNMNTQKKALKDWITQLDPAVDYDPDAWVKNYQGQPANFFEHYIRVLSDVFKTAGAKVNFALVGACDGTNDRTIRDTYLVNPHWHGVFVEPFEMNFRDLSDFMSNASVTHRTFLIHAAATSQCNSSTIKMKRPTFEETAPDKPHWMRRQIGAVVPTDKLDRPMTGGWVAEFVRCVTGDVILKDWAKELNRRSKAERKKKGKGVMPMLKKVRPHVLKVDVEGHDYDVLISFFREEFQNNELPLLINFEAKSIGKYWNDLKAMLEGRGYVVSHFATDGFALLRGDRVSKNKSKKKKEKKVEE